MELDLILHRELLGWLTFSHQECFLENEYESAQRPYVIGCNDQISE